MGWFRPSNRTKEWQPQDFKLRVDLSALTLNSIACGQLADCLDFLGPGEPGALSNEYVFANRGVTLKIDREALDAFHIHLQPTDDDRERGIQPFVGEVLHEGQSCALGSKVGVANLVSKLGRPFYMEETADLQILTYRRHEREWELILDREGRGVMISVFQ